MKLAYRPRIINCKPGEEPEDFVVENLSGYVLRASKSQCIALGFTEGDIATAMELPPGSFIACPHPLQQQPEAREE